MSSYNLSAEREQTCLLSSSVTISLRTNERSHHRRWRGDSHTFRRSPMRSHPLMRPLISIFSSEETPQNFLKFESLGTDLKEPLGTKAFSRLDNNRSDVLRSRWRPNARARPPYQSLTGQPHQLKEENGRAARLRARPVPQPVMSQGEL